MIKNFFGGIIWGILVSFPCYYFILSTYYILRFLGVIGYIFSISVLIILFSKYINEIIYKKYIVTIIGILIPMILSLYWVI